MTSEIKQLSDQVTGFGGKLDDSLAALLQAEEAARDAAASAQSLIDDNQSAAGSFHTLYVDSVGGADDNSGSSSGSAVKTWAAACDRLLGGRSNRVRIMNPMEINTAFFSHYPPIRLVLEGWRSNGGKTSTPLTFIHDPESGYSGGLYSYNGLQSLIFDNTPIVLANENVSRSPFFLTRGFSFVQFVSSPISRDPAATGGAFLRIDTGHIALTSSPIDPTAEGFVIYGVAAGGNPNVVAGLSSNFTSA